MLTRFQCYFLERDITLKWEIIRIRKKIMGHSFFHEESIYENFKTLAYMVLVKLCFAQESDKIKLPEISKGYNSNKILLNYVENLNR